MLAGEAIEFTGVLTLGDATAGLAPGLYLLSIGGCAMKPGCRQAPDQSSIGYLGSSKEGKTGTGIESPYLPHYTAAEVVSRLRRKDSEVKS